MLPETQVLIAANGNVALAAETLNIDPHILLAKVAGDETEGLKQALEVARAMHLLDALEQVKMSLLENLDELPPAVKSKLFLSLLEQTHQTILGTAPVNLTQVNDNRQQFLNLGEAADDARATIFSKLSSLAPAS